MGGKNRKSQHSLNAIHTFVKYAKNYETIRNEKYTKNILKE